MAAKAIPSLASYSPGEVKRNGTESGL